MAEERKILFIHDGPIYYDELSKKYFGIHYDDNLIKRYSYFGKYVSFLMRLRKLPSYESIKYSRLNSLNFSVIEIPNFKSIRYYLLNKAKAKRIINAAVIEHDIIIIRMPSAAGTIAYHLARKYNKPVLIEMVACVFDALWNYDWRGKIQAHYKMYSYKRMMVDAKHTIYVTNKFLQKRYPTKGKSIGCSDVELVQADDSILENRLKRILKKNGPIVLGTTAALDVPYKGQSDVIKAIGKLKKEGIIFIYKLVGQGDQSNLKLAAERNNVRDQVEIIGSLPHSDVFNFLEEIDVYIQPSKQEGLPRAVVEAMSRACPALGSNIAGIPELIDKECLFDAGKIDQIIEKLKMINNYWMQKQAGKNFEKAKEYQKEELKSRREAFYDQCLVDWGFIE